MREPPLLDIQHVTYSYPGTNATAALRDVTLQIQPGEYVALLGHNGSGKSTLARHCNALLLPDQGSVRVMGWETTDVRKQRAIREAVGMIFQHPDNQLIATVVEDDVAWGLTMRGLPAELIRERVAEALAAVGIAHLSHLPPHKLSGGQRQRVAIAGILAMRPHCIIADEATAALDPLTRQEIIRLLVQLNREAGLAILHVTHLLEEIIQAERVVVMEHGTIIMDAPPATILSDIERLRGLRLAIPEPIALAVRLRDAGIPIATTALTVEDIAAELVQYLGNVRPSVQRRG